MKTKVFITILIIFIFLICSIVGIWIVISPKDATITLAKDNVINENTIDTSTNTFSDEVTPETNTIVVEETKLEMSTEPEKDISKQDDTVVEKTVSKTTSTSTPSTNTATTSTNKNIQNNKTTNTQSSKNANTKSTTSSSNMESTKPKEDTTKKTVDKPTETKPVAQPTRCTHNDNHGMEVGNCERWFNSKSEAIAFYEQKINYWGKLWENYEIEDSEYYKNCPTGYEIWSCMYCSKWTINIYYR